MLFSLGCIAVYVLLVGIASFLEKLYSGSLDAFQLNLSVRVGALLLAVSAAAIVHGSTMPSPSSAFAGLGIGVLAGIGVLFYFFALKRLPVWLVVCLADAYVLVTACLGFVVLGEAATPGRICGLVLTVTGIIILSYQSERLDRKKPDVQNRKRLVYLASMVPYIALLGTSAFLEKPALKQLDPLQLNALVAAGMSTIALVAFLVRDHSIPLDGRTLKGVGVGSMMGAANIFYYLGLVHLPVSVGATVANTYILVTVFFTVVVWHRSLTALNLGAIGALVLGVVLLTIRIHI